MELPKLAQSRKHIFWIMAVLGHPNRTIKEIETKRKRSVKDKYEGIIMVGLKMREKN